MDCFVPWEDFDDLKVSFLPVQPTHKDNDEYTSATSDCLRQNNATTVKELHTQLCETNN